jgi:hypothetical protein
VHCNGNSAYIFLFWELRGLSPNFHIHVSVSDLYIPRIGPHISSSRKGRPIVETYNSLTMGLRPRYSFFGNICFNFSAFCLCSVMSRGTRSCMGALSSFFHECSIICMRTGARTTESLNFRQRTFHFYNLGEIQSRKKLTQQACKATILRQYKPWWFL